MTLLTRTTEMLPAEVHATGVPIRVKILVGVLCVIMLVIGVISATMANLFHTDKTTYVHAQTAMIARHGARETAATIADYVSNLRMFESVAVNPALNSQDRSELIGELFNSHRDLVAVGVASRGRAPTLVFDRDALSKADLTEQTLGAGLEDGNFPGVVPPVNQIQIRNVTTDARLPLLGIAFTVLRDKVPTVLIGWVRLNRLIDITTGSGAYESVLRDAQGRAVFDARQGFLAGAQPAPWFGQYTTQESRRAAESTLEVLDSGEQKIVGLAPVGVNQLVMTVAIPKSAAYLTSRSLLRRLLYVAFALFTGAGVLALIFAHRLTGPLERLADAARAVGQGQFDVEVETHSTDEIGLLAHSFNQMTGELKDREQQLELANRALIQSEKMAAFGQMGAGIAHEVKNPLAGILGYAQLGINKLAEDHPVTRHLKIIEKETRRCTEIIGNLMKFARREPSAKNAIDANEPINDAVSIVEHQLGLCDVKLHTDLAADMGPILGNANQIEQVLVNLMINAQQAMLPEGGNLYVTSRETSESAIEVTIRDDGPGMSAATADRIFEPFFSTKEAGSGTGLGLAVVYGIVEDHGGEISVDSKVGEGTTFVIRLPLITDAQ